MDFDAAVAELAQLVETLEREGDERALLLLQLVDAIHRPALERVAAGDVEHPLVQALVSMYLDPLEPEVMAEEALDEVRPYIESHGGHVELLGVDDGIVRVRLEGACVGCAGSAMTLRRGVEDALRRRLPGFREVVAEEGEASPPAGRSLPMAPAGAPAPAGPSLPIVTAGGPSLRRPVFVEVGALDDLDDGSLTAVEAEGVPVLLARHRGDVYALRNGCATDGLPLEGSRLTAEGVLVCPWHNCAYDVRTGARVDDGSGRLGVVPVAVAGGAVKIAANVA